MAKVSYFVDFQLTEIVEVEEGASNEEIALKGIEQLRAKLKDNPNYVGEGDISQITEYF